jgi:voltage-gated potassium channel
MKFTADKKIAPKEQPAWRKRLYVIIFEADTPLGKAFDVALLVVILLSVLAVMLETVPEIQARHKRMLVAAEWVFTGLFTLEYILRLICVSRPLRYARSFFGVIDLLAILPSYLNLLFAGAHYFMVIRVLRMLRVFRIFKLVRYLNEADVLMAAMKASRRKITVFLWTVVTLVVVIGALMYLIEGEEHGFTSMPRSVYWAVVTLTTVGYGDIAPETSLGRFVACFVMVMGYGLRWIKGRRICLAAALNGDRLVIHQSSKETM